MSALAWVAAAVFYALIVIAIVRLMRHAPRDQEWIVPTRPVVERRQSKKQ